MRYEKRTETQRARTPKGNTSEERARTHSGPLLWLCFVGVLYRICILFFKLQLSGRLHGAAGYILTSLFVIAIAFHFGKMRSVYVYHNTYKVMQHKASSKRKKQFITWWRIAWDLSVPVMILSYSSIWWTEGVYHWLFSLFYISIIVAAISYIVLSIFTDDFDPDTCYYPWYNPWYYPWHYPFNNSSDD